LSRKELSDFSNRLGIGIALALCVGMMTFTQWRVGKEGKRVYIAFYFEGVLQSVLYPRAWTPELFVSLADQIEIEEGR